MNIIGGIYKGRKLNFLKDKNIRPTQDKVREALFNIIMRDIEGKVVLDLFAGCGSLGLEAISRGAENVTFVDNNRECVDIITENACRAGLPENRYEVVRMDAFKAIEKIAKENRIFDIIIADPPYYLGLAKKILIKLTLYDILAPNNIIIVQHFKKDDVPGEFQGIVRLAEKKYGDTLLSFFRKVYKDLNE